MPWALVHRIVFIASKGKLNLKLSKFFYAPTNAQVIVLKTILKFALKLHSNFWKKEAILM
jgi:hypothetical protein